MLIILIAIYIGFISQSICFASPKVTIDSLRRIQRACAENNTDAQINNIDFLLRVFSTYLYPGKKFVDLGSGDGRIVLLASMYGADSIGIEIDPVRFQTSLDATRSLHALVDSKRIHFFNKDILKSDLSSYDVFYICKGWPESDDKILQAKLSKEAKPGSLFILYDPSRVHINNAILIEEFNVFDGKSMVDKVQIYKKVK